MKALTTICSLLLTFSMVYSQSSFPVIQDKSDCAPVTRRMLEQQFPLERQLEIQSSPEDLACLDYICSRSYEFSPGQMVLRSQRALFNVEKYRSMRRVDQRITVFDNETGLEVTIYSWNEVEAALIAIRTNYQLASCD